MSDAVPVYCTGGCDVCRDYARELGVPLITPASPVRYMNHGGSMSPDPDGQWVHVKDLRALGWKLDPAIPFAVAEDES